jgi:hypothetical protein
VTARPPHNGDLLAWRSAPEYAVLNFSAIWRHRREDGQECVAERPLGSLAEALLCIEYERRNEFATGFGLPTFHAVARMEKDL